MTQFFFNLIKVLSLNLFGSTRFKGFVFAVYVNDIRCRQKKEIDKVSQCILILIFK